MIAIEDLEKATAQTSNGLNLNLTVRPGAQMSCIKGLRADRLVIDINSRAVDGAANKALIEFFAKRLAISKSSVTLLRGHRSRQKTVFFTGEYKQILEALFKTTINID
ncbi:MAG: DUF167 domain-containing protein [Candidatus Obscuribacterales bacterium]|nr:DUF167 domain-containing protein [Candidatus Obscuribacterales bacterium]